MGDGQARNRRGRRTYHVEMLKLRDSQDEGGVAGKLLLQSSPELRFANRSGPGLYLGIKAYHRLQASELLAQRGSYGAAFFSGSSGPSSPGCLRRPMKGGFRRRHVRDRHLAITRHLLSLRKEEGEARDGKQMKRKSCGD